MNIPLLLRQTGHALAAVVFGWLVLTAYRWVRQRSEALGVVFALGILVRIVMGVTLFWISYLHLPIARSLQLGNGFWQVTADATGYYQLAAGAADAGRFFPLDHAEPAPFFLNTLTAWMMAVGVGPAAGMFLNLVLYVALVVVMVGCFAPVNNWLRDLPCLAGVAAYSFSPVVLLHSTQPLKDELSGLLIALACFGVLAVRRLMNNPRTMASLLTIALGASAIFAATLGTAGIRWYNAVVIVSSLALLIAVFAVWRRTTPLSRYLAGSFAVLLAAWVGFAMGAGPFYEVIGANIAALLKWEPPRNFSKGEIVRSGTAAFKRIGAIPGDLVNIAQLSRSGFLTSGGNTNVVVPLREDAGPGLDRMKQLQEQQQVSAAYRDRLSRLRGGRLEAHWTFSHLGFLAPVTAEAHVEFKRIKGEVEAVTLHQTPRPPPPEFRSVPVTVQDHLRAAAFGLAVVFVPISALERVFGFGISGGRGLLLIADLDTLFLDVTVLLVLGLLWTRRRAIGDRLPFVVFALIVAATNAVLLGYVVTNYGTLWRLRTAAAVPLWILVVALSPRGEQAHEPRAAKPAVT
ncbi:MAG TPA: hypothetical protein VGJ39_12835 [Vicinamibacterales bacterium]|jgi:hypothetical protein